MASQTYLGMPPPHIVEWIERHPLPHPDTRVTYTLSSGLEPWSGLIEGVLKNDRVPNNREVETIDIGTAVTSITELYVYNLSGTLIIPDTVLSIGYNAFNATRKLTQVIFGNGVVNTGFNAFCGSGISSVTFGSRISCIDQECFYGCENLTSIVIPKEITLTDGDAFHGCTALIDATIDSRTIRYQAFYNCQNLQTVTIGANVERIEYDTFYDCSKVTDVYGYADPTKLSWNDDGCDDFGQNTIMHVYQSQLEYWRSKFTSVNVTFVGDLT